MGWEEGLEGCGGVMSERAGVGDWKVVWGFFTCMQFAQITETFRISRRPELCSPAQSKLTFIIM